MSGSDVSESAIHFPIRAGRFEVLIENIRPDRVRRMFPGRRAEDRRLGGAREPCSRSHARPEAARIRSSCRPHPVLVRNRTLRAAARDLIQLHRSIALIVKVRVPAVGEFAESVRARDRVPELYLLAA
jgi:hypothetical protein